MVSSFIMKELTRTDNLDRRFWYYTSKLSDEECWNFSGSISDRGYGRLKAPDKRWIKAHRYSYLIHKGKIPSGLFILHTCDNASCVNPNHLVAGTAKENSDQMFKRGRAIRRPVCGSAHPYAKLTETDIPVIRQLAKEGMLHTHIARRYGVAIGAIHNILRRISWKHVP